MLSDRVQRSSAEARVEEIKGGSVGVVELIQKDGGEGRMISSQGSSSSRCRRTPEIVLQGDHASFRTTSGPPVQWNTATITPLGGEVVIRPT